MLTKHRDDNKEENRNGLLFLVLFFVFVVVLINIYLIYLFINKSSVQMFHLLHLTPSESKTNKNTTDRKEDIFAFGCIDRKEIIRKDESFIHFEGPLRLP